MAVSVNTVNFMDGINGITAGVIGLWGVVMMLSADGRPAAGALYSLGAIALGAAIGFMPFNAVIPMAFLGDVGSYLFGGMVGAGSLLAVKAGLPILLVMAPMSMYLVDVSWTLARRARRRAPLLSAHREHVYQRLTQVTGLPHSATTAFVVVESLVVVVCVAALPLAGAIPASGVALLAYLSSPVWVPSLLPSSVGHEG
jgi:UDP-N-acetylmuramyl pentapeptide phosphotransferase/UDP-N-acetylglucosamine-1-phosphate transferase